MLRRALAPALVLVALAAPVHADPVPAAVTHGTVQVELQTFRCKLYVFRLTGTFQIGARTWHGTASGAMCHTPGDTSRPLVDSAFDLNGTSDDGALYAHCTTNLTLDEDFSGDPEDPAALVCRAGVDGSFPVPLVLAVKTHPVTPQPPYTVREGSFYGA